METLKNTKTKLAAVNKDIFSFINTFVDDMSFVETNAFMCSDDGEYGNGVVGGFASVEGKPICLFVMNSKVLKGAIGANNAKKIVRTVHNAVASKKPLVAVWDTSGAKLTDGIDALAAYGSILGAFADAYNEIPVISVVKGNNLGMSAYVSRLSDFVISYKDGVLASASPLVIAAKNGADVKSVGSAERAATSEIGRAHV